MKDPGQVAVREEGLNADSGEARPVKANEQDCDSKITNNYHAMVQKLITSRTFNTVLVQSTITHIQKSMKFCIDPLWK